MRDEANKPNSMARVLPLIFAGAAGLSAIWKAWGLVIGLGLLSINLAILNAAFVIANALRAREGVDHE